MNKQFKWSAVLLLISEFSTHLYILGLSADRQFNTINFVLVYLHKLVCLTLKIS